MGRRHRSVLKQQNKPFKGGSSKPKERSLKQQRRAQAAAAVASSSGKKLGSKVLRQQKSRQKRLLQKQHLEEGAAASHPKSILLISFSDAVNSEAFHRALTRLLRSDSAKSVEDAEEGMAVDSECPVEKGDALSQVLFSLPPFARNPQLGKKKQQILLLRAPPFLQLDEQQRMRETSVLELMDSCFTSDVLVCLFGGTCDAEKSAFSGIGYRALQSLRLGGVPQTVIGVGIADVAFLLGEEKPCFSKLNAGAPGPSDLKFMRRYFESELGADRKFVSVQGPEDLRTLLRAIGAAPIGSANGKLAGLKAFKARRGPPAPRDRGGLMALDWKLDFQMRGERTVEPVLEIVGFERGCGLTCKLPVHLTGVGDFVIEKIESVNMEGGQEPSLECVEALSKEDLKTVVEESQPLQELDHQALEQSVLTAEDFRRAEKAGKTTEPRRRIRLPKNVGEYEGAWLESEEEECEESGGEEESAMDEEGDAEGEALNEAASDGEDWESIDEDGLDRQGREEDGALRLRLQELQAEDGDPNSDKLFLPYGICARDRFQKYRGLKSYRQSPWNADELTPLHYGQIIDVSSIQALASFARREHQAFCEERSAASRGLLLKLTLPLREVYVLQQDVADLRCENELQRAAALACAASVRLSARFGEWRNGSASSVSEGASHAAMSAVEEVSYALKRGLSLLDATREAFLRVVSSLGVDAKGSVCSSGLVKPLCVFQLLRHESQVTILHARLDVAAPPQGEEALESPPKSKEEVLVVCGFRRFFAKPSFSEESALVASLASKNRYLRCMTPDSRSQVASFYAPLCIPPANCVVFKTTGLKEGRGPRVVAWGALKPPSNSTRKLLIKRVLLCGSPFRTHKRRAVIRFMFSSPEDVRWFSRVELQTRGGLRGRIEEPVGTHGYMKCFFNSPLKHNDEVYLPLYRRVFPKWFPPAWGGRIENDKDGDTFRTAEAASVASEMMGL